MKKPIKTKLSRGRTGSLPEIVDITRDLVDEVLRENRELRKEKSEATKAVGSLSMDNAELRECLKEAVSYFKRTGGSPCKMLDRWVLATETRLKQL